MVDTKNVMEILDDVGYEYSEYSGCFNLIAKKDSDNLRLVLIKILNNIDSFQFSQSSNLKIISNYLKAYPFLVGHQTRKEVLEDNVIYERFDIPSVTPKTLENILVGNVPVVYRSRGGLFAEIDPEDLRKKREHMDISQKGFAEKIGISKKSVYEHERKKMLAKYGVVVKIEKVIGSISVPFTLKNEFERESSPPIGFARVVSSKLKKLGLETKFIGQAPFNLGAESGRILIFSEAEDKSRKIEKNIPYIESFSNITEKPVIIIAKEEIDIDIPYVIEKDLEHIENIKSLRKYIKSA